MQKAGSPERNMKMSEITDAYASTMGKPQG